MYLNIKFEQLKIIYNILILISQISCQGLIFFFNFETNLDKNHNYSKFQRLKT